MPYLCSFKLMPTYQNIENLQIAQNKLLRVLENVRLKDSIMKSPDIGINYYIINGKFVLLCIIGLINQHDELNFFSHS